MPNHDEILDTEWMNQQTKIKEIYEHGVPMFISSIANLADAFKSKDTNLHGTDEQTPDDTHLARIIYYDGTGLFDYNNVTDLLPGILVNRRLQPKDDALAEVKAAIRITTGDQGFGSRIDKENPLVVIAIGSPRDEEFSLQALEQELRDAGIASDKIIIDAFTAPRI